MTQTVQFSTGDGKHLVGDLSVPDDAIGAAIVCHPHPQYGGSRHNNVVQALFDAFPAAGIAALRFDFRSDFDNGRGERLDAIAALDHLVAAIPDVAMFVTGYSFGAAIALGLDDERIAAKALVAPPLATMPVARSRDVDTLILTPEHDQFSTPAATAAIVSNWPMVTHETIASTDHFLAGRTAMVAQRTIEFLTARIR